LYSRDIPKEGCVLWVSEIQIFERVQEQVLLATSVVGNKCCWQQVLLATSVVGNTRAWQFYVSLEVD
jgi:hypothetical protein